MRVRPQKPQAPYTHSPNPLSSEHSLPSRLSVLLDNPLKGLICEPVCTPTPIHKYKGLLQNKNRLAKSTHPDTHRLRVFKSMQVQIVIHGGLIFQQEPQEKCKGGLKSEGREEGRGHHAGERRIADESEDNPFALLEEGTKYNKLKKQKGSSLPFIHVCSSRGPSIKGCCFSSVLHCCWLVHIIECWAFASR